MIGATLTQGWSGIALAYAAVQVPMIVGLVRARAQLHHYILSPLVAAPLTAIAAVGVAVASSWLGHHGWLQLTLGTGLGAALGYAGGASAGQKAGPEKAHQRGSV